MSIFKAASLSHILLSVPDEFYSHRALLEQLLGVKPRVRFVDEPAAAGAFAFAGCAHLDQNRVEINLADPLPQDTRDLSETLAHEMRHIWQHANGRKAFPIYWCQEKAEWARYWSYSEDQDFLLDMMRIADKTDSQTLGYLMSWEEVDARAYAAWFLYEREQGLPYVEPQSDVAMLEPLMRQCGIRNAKELPDSFIFDAFLKRMFLAEVRIQRAYVEAGLYDKAEAK